MLQKSCKSDFSTFPAARNHQPPVRVSATGRQRIGNDLQGRQCCTAVFAGRLLAVIPDETRMRGKAQPDGRPAVEMIETLVRLSLIPTRATPLFD